MLGCVEPLVTSPRAVGRDRTTVLLSNPTIESEKCEKWKRLKKRHAHGIIPEAGRIMKINTPQDVQRFKALSRKKLVRRNGRRNGATFSLAVANRIKHQPLDVSRVVILDHEISPDA